MGQYVRAIVKEEKELLELVRKIYVERLQEVYKGDYREYLQAVKEEIKIMQ